MRFDINGYINDNLNREQYGKVASLLEEVEPQDIEEILKGGASIQGITIQHSTHLNLLLKLLFLHDTQPIIAVLCSKLRGLGRLSQVLETAIGKASFELSHHANSVCKAGMMLDTDRDFTNSIVLSFGIALNDNINFVASFLSGDRKRSALHKKDMVLKSFYSYFSDSTFRKYRGLVMDAQSIISHEINAGKEFRDIFEEDGCLKSNYVRHLINQAQRFYPKRYRNLSCKRQVVSNVLDRETVISLMGRGADIDDKIRSCLDRVFAQPYNSVSNGVYR